MNNNSAPALRRGIRVLRLLGQNPATALSLEEISRGTGFPKSSLTRIMQALMDLDLVVRYPGNRKYQAISRIVPLRNSMEALNISVGGILPRLARKTGQTAEWYVFAEAGMTMVRRADPPQSGIQVRAGLGFTRSWQEELDSVSCLGEAFFHSPKQSATGECRYWRYNLKGNRINVTPGKFAAELKKARKQGFVFDEIANPNGVRRMSCVVFKENEPAGILTLAEVVTHVRKTSAQKLLAMLVNEARKLCQNSSFKFADIKLTD